MKKALVLIFTLLISLGLYANDRKADSLKNALRHSTSDTARFVNSLLLDDHFSGVKQDSASFYLKQAIVIAIKCRNPEMLMEVYKDWGFDERVNGNYASSLQLQFKAFKLADSLKDANVICELYNSIGNTYREYKMYADARKYYLLEKELGQNKGKELFVFSANVNLGHIYRLLNRSDSALMFENDAYTYAVKTKSAITYQVYGELAEIQLSLNNRGLAYNYFKMAIAGNQKDNLNVKLLSVSYLDFAGYYSKYGMNDSALYFANQALAAAKSVPYLKGIADAGKLLADIYDTLHHPDSAFHYQKVYMAANDSMYSISRSAELENQTLLEQLHEQEQEETRRENRQYAATAFGIIVFISIFLLISRSLIANAKLIAFLGIIALLMVFEFLNLFLHPFLERITHHTPIFMLLIMVGIAAILTPLHHWLEHKALHRMVEKNKEKRLAAAKKAVKEPQKEEAQ